VARAETKKNTPVEIGGQTVEAGENATIDVDLGRLYTHTPVTIPVQVFNGRRDGPTLLVSAALHGDELNGVEIIRRLVRLRALKQLKGTLIAVPVVNVHGLLTHSRYLPDRRDLNRSFPGSEKGSLARRVAYVFLEEIVKNCTHAIDLHTGAVHRYNLPQIRGDLDGDEGATLDMANAFGAPVILNSNIRDGSLREAASDMGMPMLVYEGGEALRFDEISIRGGLQGIVNVMRSLGMLRSKKGKEKAFRPVVARSSSWERAPGSGIFRSLCKPGDRVQKDQTLLGVIADPFGEKETEIYASHNGIIIGQTLIPLANEGDALFHIARFGRTDRAAERVETFQDLLESEPELAPMPYPGPE